MYLNTNRVHSRNALAVAIGTAVANSHKPVPASLFEGVCESDQEAAEMAFRVNVKRNEAIFAAKARHGLAGVLGA